MRGQHVQCYNNFLQNGHVIDIPENWKDRLLGPIWGSATTEQHNAHGTQGAAAATHHAAVPPPQLPADQPLQALQEQLYGTLAVGHDAQSTAQPAVDPGVCVLAVVSNPGMVKIDLLLLLVVKLC